MGFSVSILAGKNMGFNKPKKIKSRFYSYLYDNKTHIQKMHTQKPYPHEETVEYKPMIHKECWIRWRKKRKYEFSTSMSFTPLCVAQKH